MLGAIGGDVFEAEARREVEIELHGSELPGTADGVDELHVNLRTVEGGFAFHLFVRDVHALHGVGESGGGALPVFGLAGVILRMRGIPIGELDFEFVEAEISYGGEGKVDAGLDFAGDL